MPRAPILYFDLGSPYSYLAVERAPSVLGVDPELEPILLGAIFERRGHGSWAHTHDREWNIAEVERRAAAYGLPPVRWPPGWPPNTLQAMRVATWAKRHGSVRELALAAYRRAFVDGLDLGDLEVVVDVAADAGLPSGEVRSAIAEPELKTALRSATEAAWEAGVRGVPSMRVGSDVYFGDDRLTEAAAALRIP